MSFAAPSTTYRLRTADPLPKLVDFVVSTVRESGSAVFMANGVNGLKVIKRIGRALPDDLTGFYYKATEDPGDASRSSQFHRLDVRRTDVGPSVGGFYAPGVFNTNG